MKILCCFANFTDPSNEKQYNIFFTSPLTHLFFPLTEAHFTIILDNCSFFNAVLSKDSHWVMYPNEDPAA